MTNPSMGLSAHSLVIDIPERPGGKPLELRIEVGELWGVLGPNGAGKTTLLHTLAGLRPARAGEVRVHGRALSAMSRRDAARRLAVVFQQHQDSFPATVIETALMGRHPHRSLWEPDSADDLRLAYDALARMELAELSQRLVNTLSGGERQRLAIASALVQQPCVWLADEPTNHLDLKHQVAVMELLAQQANAGRAVIVCLHDINIAARWCDRLLLLYPDGDARWGSADALLDRSMLERLYGQPLEVVCSQGVRVFVPSVPSPGNSRSA